MIAAARQHLDFYVRTMFGSGLFALLLISAFIIVFFG